MERIRVVLVGNPNVGKTSLLNHLTGATFQIGNFPGVTVEKKEGWANYQGIEIVFIDLPGVYTLDLYTSIDEKVAVEYLQERDYDVVLNVIESPKLERDLYLTLQLASLQKPVVIALNMADEAEDLGLIIDEKRLSELLRVPVVKTVGKRGVGVRELFSAIVFAFKEKSTLQLTKLSTQVLGGSDLENPDYTFLARGIAKEVSRKKLIPKRGLTNLLDTVLLHPFLGFVFLIFIYYLMFKTVFDLSGPLIEFLDAFFSDFIGRGLAYLLNTYGFPEFFVQFISSALIGGVGTVLTFTPVIFLMFFFITLLETSGYLPRVAFLMDRFTHHLGLHGHSVIPLVLGFGCNVPAILALRVLSDPKDRLIVMSMIPFMSCGARLVIFSFFAQLFFKNPVLVVLSLYLLGIMVAFITALILQKTIYKKGLSHFVMDLPPYRLPHLRMLFRILWVHVRSFLVRAGTVIFVISVVIWLLLNLPPGEKNLEETYAGRVGKVISQLFAPIGLSDWRIGTSLIPAFLAREAILSTLAVIVEEEEETEMVGSGFDLAEESKRQLQALGLAMKKSLSLLLTPYPTFVATDEEVAKTMIRDKVRALFTTHQALSFLVFILIYLSCTATLATIWREAGKKFAFLYFLYSLLLAYALSLVTFHVAKIF